MKPEIAAVHILVKGRVQGVGYRFFTQDAADSYGLKGWVRNLPGGNVEAEVEGPKSAIESFLEELRRGPPVARVDNLEVNWLTYSPRYKDFEIRG
jgi:acylphosphatase